MRQSKSPMPRATKRGTPVAMPARTTKRVSNMPMKPGNIATGAKKTAKPKPTGKATKKKVITPRKLIDPSKMTPQQKKAYYDQPGYDNY